MYGMNPELESTTDPPPEPTTVANQGTQTFLVQVNREVGYSNIMERGVYENDRWMEKPRDSAHGEVKRGDQLLVYCTRGVPQHGMSLAFSAVVTTVSHDQISFKLDDPRMFISPLRRAEIHELVNDGELADVFRKCGQQGFNIAKLDSDSAVTALRLLSGELTNRVGRSQRPNVNPVAKEAYTTESIISDGCFLDASRLVAILDRLKARKNLILQGPPGTGKTWLAKRLAFVLIGSKSERQMRPFQFHPNLSYEDFVRGWRPNVHGRLDLVDGPFLNSINDSHKDPCNTYVVVIEEINRGNPAQIFGEMLTLLEADKRYEDEALPLSYPRDHRERVHIPSNFYIIGTMNVADRSLALVDFALRRRFAFFDLEPAFGELWRNWVNVQYKIDTEFLADVEERVRALNKTISEDNLLGPQFRIGHSFVTPTTGVPITNPNEWFTQVVNTEIGPLLAEYWFDDPEKARSECKRLLHGLAS